MNDHREIPRAREWDAQSYDRVGGHMARRGAGVLERIDLRGDEVVLDAGCGTGRVTALILERLPKGRVIALDGSARMLDQARERLDDDRRVRFVHADLTTPIDLGEDVEVVVSTSALHWVPDHLVVFRGFASMLQPGGRLHVDCGGAGNIAGVQQAIAVAGVTWSPWNFRSDADAEEALAAAGFEHISTWLHPDPLDLEPEDLSEYLRTVILGSHLERLEPAARDAFVHAVVEAMPEPRIDYVRLNIDAVRANVP
jgi:trans-aconitate 2-methyltransferase